MELGKALIEGAIETTWDFEERSVTFKMADDLAFSRVEEAHDLDLATINGEFD